MKIEVLISCMYQSDFSIISNSNIQTDAIVINQCNENKIEEFNFINCSGESCRVKFISTTDRGLSKSRNMALKYATGDICLICDDDEVFEDDYAIRIEEAFSKYPDFSVLAFRFRMPDNYYMTKTFWNEPRVLDYKSSLKISSWQIAFRRKDIIDSDIQFDEKIGSGMTKAGGEEKIFLHNCLQNNLKLIYVPISIGAMNYQGSQWVDFLFSKSYFIDWGYYTRRLKWGRPGALAMSAMFAIKKRKDYKQKCNPISAFLNMLYGVMLKK